ncbi:MAG: excinuclease ATPase subunit [Agathobacter sp.]|uniref:Excinuclease ATPase subunit n=2 Tax=Lachnospiraceae TaxID=186803 RepID=A0A2G3E599_9FIRM|nr:excinuclease ATPase subunit [Agathobacter sp.]MCR5677616.1 excinuclease ATPase subunit [Agathobacter sp.]PHU38458.1 excinuclease ATPase subunit [Agathobacter ruminis]
MTWGPSFMYYICPNCGKKFKYALDMIPEFGDDYGKCPVCGTMGTYEKDGARTKDDADYEEVDE